MARKRPPQPPGWLRTKISATLLQFGEPLIMQLPIDATIELRRSTIGLVITIWNAHVMAMPEWGKPEYLAEMRERLTRGWAEDGLDIDAIRAFELLSVRRKQKPFANDPRAIGHWEVRMLHEANWNVFCEAHVPEALRQAYADHIAGV